MKRLLLFASLLICCATANAARVVALSPHLAELVCAAGACEQLVGVVRHSDYPAAVQRLPVVGDAFNLNAEAVLALQPDLVLSWGGGTPAASEAQMRRLGVEVLSLRVESLADIAQALRELGQRLSTAAVAQAAAAQFEQQIAALRLRYVDARPLRVFYQIEAGPIYTINRHSPISEAITLCGGVNVFADLPRLSAAVGVEPLLAADPEVVVWGRQDQSAAIRTFWQRWPQLRAVRNGDLYEVDADTLTRATPRMVQGIMTLCAALDAAREK